MISVAECDVDILLLDEFASEPAFSLWFASKCGLSNLELEDDPVLSVARGVVRSSGESDIEVSLMSKDGSVHYLLIESKVAASFQPRQAERYRERGQHYIDVGECSSAATVLVAPECYLGSDATRFGFDCSVTYESLVEWFAANVSEMARYTVKHAVLTCAIDKAKLGYLPVPDHPVTNFWQSYWRLCNELAPELQMPEPGDKPASAGFITFQPYELPQHVTLLHKLRQGNVDLQFRGMGKKLDELQDSFGHSLEVGMRIARANKSGSVRLLVPSLDTTASLKSQEESVRKGIEAA